MDLRELQEQYRADARRVTDERINIGALIRTVLSTDDGLVFKGSRTEKPKRLVIYPDFLDYDSYADCAEIFSIPIAKLKAGEYFGNLTPDDLSGIFNILETTDTLSTKEKKRFGIRRR